MKGRLVIFCGIPGSGKTTIARLVAGSIANSILVQTDGVRRMIAEPTFSPEESRMVYDACFAIAKEALKSGYLVILDGTFMREEYRQEAQRLLRRYYARVDVVWVRCGLQTALQRNSARRVVVPPVKVKAMFDGFEGPRSAIGVDSSHASAESAARRIVAALEERHKLS
jgi:predicted kinase